jgi:hypothetical protein
MEQQLIINSTFDRMSLIHNVPVQFSINNRRIIEFTFPTVRDTMSDLNFRTFLGIISLTPDKVKEKKIEFKFIVEKQGDIIQGLISSEDYSKVLVPYFLKYIKNSVKKTEGIYVDEEKVMSYELDYIVDKILVSLGKKNFEEEKEKNTKPIDPVFAKILEAQKKSEEKLKKAKASKNENNVTIEEIMLALCYEFGFNYNDLLELNYFTLIWHFGYVGKVDGHKLNQMILSSGLSKQKNYSYWLNK